MEKGKEVTLDVVIKIDGYSYTINPTKEAIKDFFIQEDSGNGTPIIRKLTDDLCEVTTMLDIANKEGYYPLSKLQRGIEYIRKLPIIATDNPFILQQI